jgi:hypothetical protein
MSNPVPETKSERLIKLKISLIDVISDRRNSGLINVDELFLQRTLREAERLKDANWSLYYEILAYMNIIRKDYVSADKNFRKAIKSNPTDDSIVLNHNRVLLLLGLFDEVEKWILTTYPIDQIDVYSCQMLYLTSLVNLDFKKFKEYLVNSSKSLALMYDLTKTMENVLEIEKLSVDLEYIGLSKDLFKEALIFIFTFYKGLTFDAFKPHFKIQSTEMNTLIVEIFLNINEEKAVELTSDFEEAFVNFAIEKNEMDFLRKISVFIKPTNLIDWNEQYSVYKGIDEDWMVELNGN